ADVPEEPGAADDRSAELRDRPPPGPGPGCDLPRVSAPARSDGHRRRAGGLALSACAHGKFAAVARVSVPPPFFQRTSPMKRGSARVPASLASAVTRPPSDST